MARRQVRWAIMASFLFALSTPPAKVLSSEQTPFLLCGLFYLGSIFGIIPSILSTPRENGAGGWRKLLLPEKPKQKEIGIAILSVLIGGGAAPILLIWGLKHYPASLGSLLMNAEGIVTVLLAWLIFREPLNMRLSIGAILGAAGCAIASDSEGSHGFSGAIPFFLAAGLWALDSNLLRFLSGWSPVTITLWKGLGSSFLLLPLGLFLPHPLHDDIHHGGSTADRRTWLWSEPDSLHPFHQGHRCFGNRRLVFDLSLSGGLFIDSLFERARYQNIL